MWIIDGKYIFVLGENGRIYIFDLMKGIQVGYIPAFSASPVTHYEFNQDETRLVIGYEDGNIYYLRTDDVILDPKAKPPRLDKGNFGSGGFGVGGESARRPHSFELRGEVYPIVKPYNVQAAVMLGYTNAGLLSPFYFGGLLKGQMAFPSSNFPSKYYYQDEVLPNPLVDSLALMCPFGFSMRPFDSSIEFFAEVDLGATIYTFYFPERGFIGRVFPAFTSEACIGVAWNGISLFACGGYDTQIGFTFSAGAGVRIEVSQ